MNGTLYDEPTFPSAKQEEEKIPVKTQEKEIIDSYLGKVIKIYSNKNEWIGTYKGRNTEYYTLENPYNKVKYLINKDSIDCIELIEN